MSTRSNPFDELERLFERMSRQFEDASRMWSMEGGMDTESGSMAVDVVEHGEDFVVTVDLPGFEREDVEIRVTDHTLQIEAEREETMEEEEENFLRRERRQRALQRSIRLPDEVNKDSVAATMKNGVLTITLPKIEAETAREIEIT